jgi:hypothetical protein
LKRHRFEVLRTFSYDNCRLTRPQITRLKRNHVMLLLLDLAGLYPLARRWYRTKTNKSPANDHCVPLVGDRDLALLKPYGETKMPKPMARLQTRVIIWL